jgi:hypothetical protein
MAAALEQFPILPDALTHYRVHAGSLFLGAGASEGGERRKARVIAKLADAFRVSLPVTGAPHAAVDAMLEIVDAEAAQLRLKLDGGWPWETFQPSGRFIASNTRTLLRKARYSERFRWRWRCLPDGFTAAGNGWGRKTGTSE